jgi:hypothetical protein
MREFLTKLLSLGQNCSERTGILISEIESAKEENVKLAYNAALKNASNAKIIYLLGGNNPETCPFN